LSEQIGSSQYMTDEQKQRLQGILSRAKSEYNNRAQGYDESVS